MRVRPRILPFFLWLIYRSISWTWRLSVAETPAVQLAVKNGDSFVTAHWHGDELVLLTLIRRYKIAAMTSTSKDGDLIDGIVRLQGGKTSRGSSTRGGVSALKGLLSLVKEGYRPSVAVDGPKGPYHKVKPGIFEVSRITQRPIFPIAVRAERAFIFKKSWNKTFLPKPFSKIHVQWGDALPAISREADPRAPELAIELETALHAAGRQEVKW